MRFSAALLSLAASASPSFAFWRMSCPGRLVTERIDPIVSPGAPSAHVHTVSGGNGLDFTMDYNSTQRSACSSCPIKKDLSNYWTPKLYYMMKNGSFQDVPQAGDGIGNYGGMTVYYLQRGGPKNDNLTAYPAGFRMLAGDPLKRSYTSDFAGQAVSFVCLNYSSTSPYFNKLPDQPCPDGLRAQVFFPSCWDGVNLDSDDHKSHMAYPTMYSYDNGPCPSTHPVHMISIFYEIIYSTIGFDWWTPAGGWQPFVFSNGDPTGYGFHGDFLNGWDVPTLQNATNLCTANSGVVEDCPVFKNNLFTNDQCNSCIVAPKVHEKTTGVLTNLPGCNPIQWANGTVTPCNLNTTVGQPFQYYKNVTGWQYMGCGLDNGVNRTFKADQWWGNAVTVEGCMDYCKSRGHAYAGLEYSTQCFCGDSLPSDRTPTPGVLGNCFSPCAGDSTEYCGGSNRLSIYYNPGTYASVSGSNSNAVPKLPVCPSSNATTYNATNGAQFQVQCGIDRSGGDIAMQYVQGGNITACMEACANTKSCSSVALSGAACYMKAGSNLNAFSNNNVLGAALLTAGTVTTSSASGSSATASSGASSAATAAASQTMCPDADGLIVNNYTIRCTSDSSVGSYSNAQASSSYLDCMTACDSAASSYCLGFVYVGAANGRGSGTCWLKTAMGTIVTGRGPNYIAAYKPRPTAAAAASSSSSAAGSGSASSSQASSAAAPGVTSSDPPDCPRSNATYYTASNGASFLIECGIDHAGGDIGSLTTQTFQACIEACSSNSRCVDVSLSGVACYLKGTVGAVNYNGVKGAKLISGPTTVNANAKFLKLQSVDTTTTTTTKKRTSTKLAAKKTKKTTKKTKKAKKAKKAKTTKAVAKNKKVAAAKKKAASKKTTKTKTIKTKKTKTVKAVKTTKSKTTVLLKTTKPLKTAQLSSRASTLRTSSLPKSSKTFTTTTRSVSKTTASPSSTVTAVDCPYSNNTFYYDPESRYQFFLECGIDRTGNAISNSTAKSLQACIKNCAEHDECEDVSYDKSDKQCYLKSKAGKEKKYVTSVNGARLVPSTTTTTTPTATASKVAETDTSDDEPAVETTADGDEPPRTTASDVDVPDPTSTPEAESGDES